MTILGQDFVALVNTIQSVYDLRGIGVQAVYVSKGLWDWMRGMESRKPMRGDCWLEGEQCYDEADVAWKTARSGALSVTVSPCGADHNIPVKIKYSGKQPWKIVVTYRKED